ncbi:MAG: IGHMBP2 family helicase [Polyangiaceae bacterium]|nr:IGHMBP2 family helicase [Polyangiaceae bacterium]
MPSHGPNAEQQLRALRQLWNLELEAVRERHRTETEQTPWKQRIADGKSAKNLRLDDVEGRPGGRCTLWFKAQKKAALEALALRPGAPVSLWGQDDSDRRVMGTLAKRSSNRLGVVVDGNYPAFLGDGPVHLDAEAPEATFERGHSGITQFLKEDRLKDLRAVLYGEAPATAAAPTEDIEFRNEHLNDSQKEAVRFALATDPIALIFGPPGTGKTHTLVEVIRQLIRRGDSVLVTAASNTALDNLGERLMAAGVKPVRVGRPERISDAVEARSLEKLIEETTEHQQAKKWMSEASDKRARHEKRKARGGRGSASRTLLDEANALTRDARRMFGTARGKVLRRFRVILSTAGGIDPRMLGNHAFDTVVLDEATQAPDPMALVAFARGAKLILAGDPEQLPPTVISRDNHRQGLASTFFERLSSEPGNSLTRMLTTQYRMHTALMSFPSEQHYGGKLEAADSIAQRVLSDLPGVSDDPERPPHWVFIDTAGKGWKEQQHARSMSTYNPEQAEFTASEVRRIIARGLSPQEIAAITPYAAHAKQLRQLLAKEVSDGLEIGSVDAFQGREKEAIVVDLVRSNAERDIGFLQDVRRTNVALTRAKRFLVVIGDSATLGEHEYYAALLQAAEDQDARRSAWDTEG